MIESNIYEEIKKVVVDCGKILLNADFEHLEVNKKEGNNNLVTKYDVLIQEKLKEELLKIVPTAYFMGEEENNDKYTNAKYLFIVDPIDGTINFSRNKKLSAVSVALLEDGKPIIGICYNPYLDEIYEARSGKGAFLNGKRICVSNKTLKDGILLSGNAPYYNELREKSVEVNNKLVKVASDYRRYGSAVIEICDIACGRAEVYFELKIMPWDYAAAGLILTEAGGKITTIDGEKIRYDGPTTILVSNGVEDYFKYLK